MNSLAYFPFYGESVEFDTDKYEIQTLVFNKQGCYPSEKFLKNVPWISYLKAYCEPVSLQMIAYNSGVKVSIDYLNFLMGYTYGYFYSLSANVFFPFTDPEIGFNIAQDNLGLKKYSYKTDDENLFIEALKFYISKDIPIRIPIDWSFLNNDKRFLPHSILLMGYDSNSFYYYETTYKDRFHYGEVGLVIPNSVLIKGVSNICKRFSFPWNYCLTFFKKMSKEHNDFRKIFKRNGGLLLGNDGLNSSNISKTDYFLSELKNNNISILKWKLKFAYYSRYDNAKFLEIFFNDKDILLAAKLFIKASECYNNAINLMSGSDNDIELIKDSLYDAELIEKEIGMIFLNHD